MNSNRHGRSVEINGAALRHVRALTGLTVTGLARGVGVTPTYLSMLETGARIRCSSEVFRRLIDQLGIRDDRALMARPALATAAA